METKEIIRKNVQVALLPLAIMVILTGCTNESSNPEWVSVELTKMNVIYLGVDNPVIIASSNHKGDMLEVTIDNGTITGTNDNIMIRPEKAGKATIKISSNGDIIGEKTLRVLSLPNPTAGIKAEVDGQTKFMIKDGISLKTLLETDEVHAELKDFLWDAEFKVVSFNLVVTNRGITKVEKSASNQFTEGQKDLLKTTGPGQIIILEDVNAIGPDGLIRKLNDITLKIM